MELTKKHKYLLYRLKTNYHGIYKWSSSHWEKLEKMGYVTIGDTYVQLTDKGKKAIQ